MIGRVDLQGRALLTIPVSNASDGRPITVVEVWSDTGFTGDLVLPLNQIKELGLRPSSVVQTTTADGRESSKDRFVAWIDWFGSLEKVEVIASSGQNVLLGVRLMLGHRLIVDYRTLRVELE